MSHEELHAALDKLQAYHRELVEFDLPPGETFYAEVGKLFEVLNQRQPSTDPQTSDLLHRVRGLMGV